MKKTSGLVIALLALCICVTAQLTTTPSGGNKKAWVGLSLESGVASPELLTVNSFG